MPPTPEDIQREIEATRAELVATIEQIADRVSPKKVAARGTAAAKVKAAETGMKARAAVESVFAPIPEGAVTPPPLGERIKWERVAGAAASVVLLVVTIVKIKGGEKDPS